MKGILKIWDYTDSVIILEQINTEQDELLECTHTSDKHHESDPSRYLLDGLGEISVAFTSPIWRTCGNIKGLTSLEVTPHVIL